jgi:hypothetical protein
LRGAFSSPLVAELAGFVEACGIKIAPAALAADTFLPGLQIRSGALLVDEARLLYPGDVLHEAGHLAVSDPVERENAAFEATPAEEMASIAWSYAAARALDIAPDVVFHPAGYKGAAAALLENFAAGRYIGVPMLQLWGMSVEPHRAAARGVPPFPHMLRWLR